MEPAEEIPALCVPPDRIGLIREAPVRRWLHGQGMWDEQFKRQSKKVFEKRREFEEKAEQIIRHATRQGLVVNSGASKARESHVPAGGSGGEQDDVRPMARPQGGLKDSRSTSTTGIIDEDRRFGPLDLDDENPPPSAIARRRDTVSRIVVSTTSLVDLNPYPRA
jgi:hypothetical protein